MWDYLDNIWVTHLEIEIQVVIFDKEVTLIRDPPWGFNTIMAVGANGVFPPRSNGCIKRFVNKYV